MNKEWSRFLSLFLNYLLQISVTRYKFLSRIILALYKMRFSFTSILFSAVGLVQSTPLVRAAKPPHFFLIGDSTVAVNGGWGDGFLSYLNSPAEGDNRGVSGSTTVSWKSSGRWDKLIQDIGAAKTDFEPVVTIQFGHNDQKVMGLDDFHTNLVDIGNQIKEAGGTPVSFYNNTKMPSTTND